MPRKKGGKDLKSILPKGLMDGTMSPFNVYVITRPIKVEATFFEMLQSAIGEISFARYSRPRQKSLTQNVAMPHLNENFSVKLFPILRIFQSFIGILDAFSSGKTI